MDHLADSDFIKKLKRVTWLIKASSDHPTDPDRELIQYGAGINIDNIPGKGIILLTCAHTLAFEGVLRIQVRKFDEDDFNFKATSVVMDSACDVALLVVKCVSDEICGKFADDATISSGQKLITIGHPCDLVWSIFVGHSAYECVDRKDRKMALRHPETCGKFVSTSLTMTPKYRIMGDFFNKDYFDQLKSKEPVSTSEGKSKASESNALEKRLNPLVPVIQCVGFACEEGHSGGPVFNTRGEILGMVSAMFRGIDIAIHASFLKKFVRDNTKSCKDALEEVEEKEEK